MRDNSTRLPAGLLPACLAAVAIAGLALWIASFRWYDAERVWLALLANYTFFTPLAAGMVVWSATVIVSNGGWMGRREWTALSGFGFALPSLAGLAALWYGSPAWAHRPGLVPAWLSRNSVFGLDLLGLALFWCLAWFYIRRRERNSGALPGAWLILVYAVVFSLTGFDLVMPLDPNWHSTLFGAYFFISGLYAGMAMWTLLTAATSQHDEDHLHDMGRLLVTFSLLTAYLMYTQLLVIWYENLPAETSFVIRRLTLNPWRLVSAALLALVYLGPLVLLLTVRAKRSPIYLGPIAGLILFGLWLERWWLVFPSLYPRDLVIGFPEAAAATAGAGALALGMHLCRLRLRVPRPTPEGTA